MPEEAMGPPSARISTSIPTDSIPKTSGENSSSPFPSTGMSHQTEPELQPEFGINGLVSDKPPEIHVSTPVDNANSMESKVVEEDGFDIIKDQRSNSSNAVPYSIPPWSGPPCHDYFLEVLKDGAIVNQFNINKKGAYMFGRVDLCDFVLEHPTVSRFHAVIQFKSNGDAYLYDVGSTHGTSVNKKQVKTRAYVDLHVGDVIRFGQSSRLYIFQGPTDLMPPEVDLKTLRNAKMRLEMRDMESSLQRAKLGAALSEGVSWGLQEDAEEEAEDDVEEITWQTYKGQLTEKQEKTREKVLKRLEKIAHMKKEIDAIRAKDIAQGGLTQGQQTQIARNEQRISQILEELENLEETLNDSIRESIGARAGGTSRGGKKGNAEDGEDYMSDDDEFYDRTKKPLKREGQSIETADTLLDKQEAIVSEMEGIKKLLIGEDEREQENEVPNAGDALDAYMSTLSSELASKKKDKLQKELVALQSELDRVSYLLKIADPSGEAARKRALKEKPTEDFMTISSSDAIKEPKTEQSRGRKPEKQVNGSQRPAVTPKASTDKLINVDATSVDSQKLKATALKSNSTPGETETAVYAAVKTQWLGAVNDVEKQDGSLKLLSDVQDIDQFVDYKDRKQILEKQAVSQVSETSEIESAAPGLIIRKRKLVEKSENNEAGPPEQSKEAELQAEDAVALLLKHSRGYGASDEDLSHDIESEPGQSQKRAPKKPKKKLGPERPSFLKPETDYETWVPPEGQSGDGRTSLNDRYGY